MKTTASCLLAAALLCSGCHFLPGKKNESTYRAFVAGDVEANVARYFGKSADTSIDAQKANFSRLMAEGNAAAAKDLRNRVVSDLQAISDYLYDEQKDYLFTGKAKLDTGFKLVDLALTGTAAAFGSTSTKSALAAAATFFGGSKLAIDENFYAKQTISSIIATMEGSRAEAEALLVQYRSADASQFSLHEGITLIKKYHRAGSVIDAVVRMNQESAAAANLRIENRDDAEKAAAKTASSAQMQDELARVKALRN